MPFITEDTPWYRRIKLYRIAADLSQQEVARRMAVEHRRYWSWENGENVPRLDHQTKLAEVLGVQPDDIFGGTKQDFTGLARKVKE